MARYIDADLLLKDIGESVVFTVRDAKTSPELRGARKILERIEVAPTANVAEVKQMKFNTVELKSVWLIRNQKTGDIILTYRTDSGNHKKALFDRKERAYQTLENYIPNKEDYVVCRIAGVKK